MAEVLLFVGIASLLVFGAATLVVAILALRTARRYVHLAEERMERLREGQARLLASRTDERWVPDEEAAREQLGLSKELERERRARRDVEGRMDRLERELAELRRARRESALPAAAGSSKGQGGTYGFAGREALPSQNALEDERVPPPSFLETSVPKPADGRPRNEKPRLGVRHPHPDDAVAGSTPASFERERVRSGASVGMFRKHYDKYLKNYEGYVELAGHLYRARDNGEVKPGSFEESHREERLRRVNDGIRRTVGRLDILEGQNPGLAADDLVSRRARVARRHSELRKEKQATNRP